MALVVDQDSVGALGPCCADPSFGECVRPWSVRRRLHDLYAFAVEHLIEGVGELGVSVADEEAKRVDPVAEIHGEIAGGLGNPRSGRVGCDTEDVHSSGVDLYQEQHIQSAQEDRVDVEEIAGQQPVGLSSEKCPPGGIGAMGCGADAVAAQVAAEGGLADPVAESGEFAVDPAVSPSWVFLCERAGAPVRGSGCWQVEVRAGGDIATCVRSGGGARQAVWRG